MRARIPTLALLLVFAGAATSARAADEAVTLRWKFVPKSVAYLIQEQESTALTTTTSGETKQAQKQVTSSTLIAELSTDAVDADGIADVTLRFLRLDSKVDANGIVISMSAVRAEGGDVTTKVELEGEVSGSDATKRILGKMLEGMLGVRTLARVKPTGEVVSQKIDGDPFADLGGGDDPTEKMMAEMMQSLLKPDEIFGLAISGCFVRLPDHAVKLGDSWDMDSTWPLMGMTITGRGKARLASAQGEGDQRTVTIEDDLAWDLDTSGFAAQMRKAMAPMMSANGSGDFSLDFALTSPEPLKMPRSTVFAVAGGHSTSSLVKGMKGVLKGPMTVKVRDTVVKSDMEITVDGKTTTTIQSERPK